MSMPEEWRSIPGWEGFYEASDQGRIRSWLRWRREPVPHILRGTADDKGYLRVALRTAPRRSRTRPVHALIALTFLGPRPEDSQGAQVRHLDGNSLNNSAANLRYGTQSENQQDSILHGTMRNGNTDKPTCDAGHPFDADNTYITPNGSRNCRACRRGQMRVYNAEHRDRKTETMRQFRARRKSASA